MYLIIAKKTFIKEFAVIEYISEKERGISNEKAFMYNACSHFGCSYSRFGLCGR